MIDDKFFDALSYFSQNRSTSNFLCAALRAAKAVWDYGTVVKFAKMRHSREFQVGFQVFFSDRYSLKHPCRWGATFNRLLISPPFRWVPISWESIQCRVDEKADLQKREIQIFAPHWQHAKATLRYVTASNVQHKTYLLTRRVRELNKMYRLTFSD